MAKITITFQEEGNDQIVLEIPTEAAQALDKFIEEQNLIYREPLQPTIDGQPPVETEIKPKYTGKADLFLQHTSKTLLEPIVSKYTPVLVDQQLLLQIQQLEEQKKQLEEQIKESFKPKFLSGVPGATGIV